MLSMRQSCGEGGWQRVLLPFAAAQFVAWRGLLSPQGLFPGLADAVLLIIAGLKIIVKLAFALKREVVPHRSVAEGAAGPVSVIVGFLII